MILDPFLTAKWKYLVMINYEIDPSVLVPFTPQGTKVDLWNGKAYVSLVGFMFLDTCVKGFPVPFHRNFEEVNLRFYVKKDDRRGVVFIKEIVPKWAIAYLARRLYNENYTSLPMKHHIEQKETAISAEYAWQFNKRWQRMSLQCQGEPYLPIAGSEEEFITEHFWGYSTQRDKGIMEYQVEHPRWRIWKAQQCYVDVEMKDLYGAAFAPFLENKPASAFLAEGSDVVVSKGRALVL